MKTANFFFDMKFSPNRSLFPEPAQSVFFALFLLFVAASCFPRFSVAMEKVVFSDEGQRHEVEGRVLYELIDEESRKKLLILQSRDGQIFIIDKATISHRESDETEFVPYKTADKELEEQLTREFPGFKILKSKNFIIVYNTSRGYAEWARRLFDQLHTEYPKYWKGRGFELKESEFPLIAVIFGGREQFRQFALRDAKVDIVASNIAAYYNKHSNRMVLCDLAGMEQFLSDRTRKPRRSELAAFLKREGAAANIATIIHEATHQIGFNTGMHDRLAHAYPLWLCEGFAILHEVPTRNSDTGWEKGLRVHDIYLPVVLRFLLQRQLKPLEAVIQSDALLQNPETGGSAYAMSWGLMAYLSQKRRDEFMDYLKIMSEKTILTPDSPEIRLQEFEKCFGSDWDALYRDMYAFLMGLAQGAKR